MVIAQVKPYIQLMRLHRPLGIGLLFMPCLWGISMAGTFSFPAALLFFIGAIAMRSFGCIVNDILDKDFDKHVKRTQSRPLASGALETNHTLILAAFCLLLGGLVFWEMNPDAQKLGLVALGLALLYPLAKRVMAWPQLFLGITFNMGILSGFTQVSNTWPNAETFWLYGASIAWTLAYDTIYALQDVEDDTLLGLGNAARFAQRAPKLFMGVSYALMFGGLTLARAPQSKNALLLLLTLIITVGVAIWRWNPRSSMEAQRLFEDNFFLSIGIWLYLCL